MLVEKLIYSINHADSLQNTRRWFSLPVEKITNRPRRTNAQNRRWNRPGQMWCSGDSVSYYSIQQSVFVQKNIRTTEKSILLVVKEKVWCPCLPAME